MIYDIFISYRREGGFLVANHLHDLLDCDGYTVSFDIGNLREGDFNENLYRRIEQCRDFLVIVDEHAFDRMTNSSSDYNSEKDWMRREIAYALKLKKNIIPVFLPGALFPKQMPSDIEELVLKNGLTYSKEYFGIFYEKLKGFLYSVPRNVQDSVRDHNNIVTSSIANLNVKADQDCDFYVDGEEREKLESVRIRKDVFISYSRKDYEDEKNNVIPGNEVSKIKEALTKAGITYFFDEEGVYPGDEFAKVIVRNIKASSVFVFLSTKNSNQSEWTASEICTAHMWKKKIIPVRIDDSIYHDDFILFISRLSHIDYFNNPEEGRRELVRSIKDFLEDIKAAEAQKVADEQRRKEELERQRRQQEEEKKLQKRIEKLETEIAALESQKTERKKAVLQKEQELKLAQVDLDACEAKIQKLQKQLQELREPKKKAEVEEKQLQKENNANEKVFRVGNVSFKMICVEGGSMGTFYIGETQVTQALWQAMMGDNPSRFEGLDHPVECVSWNDICGKDGKGTDPNCFLYKLNQKTGKNFRLPTEAEWEYAAKGGNKSKSYTFAGSDDIDKVAWYWKNSGDNYLKGSDDDWDWDKIKNNCKTHSVKQLSPNELGIYDMSGNVWEWCEDLYEPSSSDRVLRGGGWGCDARHCRVSIRDSGSPDNGYSFIGFRLVLPQ